jgi:hypothetical protein
VSTTSNGHTTSKATYAGITASITPSSIEMIKDVVTDVIKARDTQTMQSTSVVFRGVEEKKSDATSIAEILRTMNCSCSIIKTQRLGKPQPTNRPGNTDPGLSKARPLLVSFSNSIEQASVLQNAKRLHTSPFKNVFVRKWLTREDQQADKELRDKCNKLNDQRGLTAVGKKPFIVISGHVRERKADGQINFKKAVNVDALLSQQPPVCHGSARCSSTTTSVSESE